MRDDLQYDLCPGCGELKPVGLIPTVLHDCPLNTVIYYNSSKFSIRSFQNMVRGKDELQSLKELLYFPYLQAMPDFETASEIERRIYSICRDSDLRTMKRLRAYVELEAKFEASY